MCIFVEQTENTQKMNWFEFSIWSFLPHIRSYFGFSVPKHGHDEVGNLEPYDSCPTRSFLGDQMMWCGNCFSDDGSMTTIWVSNFFSQWILTRDKISKSSFWPLQEPGCFVILFIQHSVAWLRKVLCKWRPDYCYYPPLPAGVHGGGDGKLTVQHFCA